ncbi:MAG: ABC transporter substrate-binding protein [Succiniclasticum sp.]|jgi:branched-chain amino acid transport system substrate-binding protein|nr:ABC transporter substrate-binding protein [Succiniclasticum sp.]MEE3479925.1 ABC transporter substrate-binding protein [Succiniclasticum sp.]
MKSWKKLASAALAAVVVAGLLGGCGGGDKKSGDAGKGGNEFVVGVNAELTGNVANYGKSMKSGFELAVEEVNKAGGINGKKVRVVEADNKSEPSESGNAATKIVTKDKVVAVIGPATSGCVAAEEPILSSNKVPLIAPCATAPGITVDKSGKVKPFVFRACFIDPYQGEIMAKFASEDLKVKKVAILHDSSSDYSKGLTAVFTEKFKAAGGTITADEAYLAKDIDFKAALTKLKATNPDAIYIPGYYEEVAKIIKQAREIGLNVPLLGCDGWDSPKLVEIAGKEATNKCYFSNAYTAEDKDPGVQKFISAYKAKFNKVPDVFALEGYNAGLVLFNALKTANSTDGTKIAEALAKTKDLQVANGKFSYDEKHNPVTTALVIELKNGVQTLNKKIG